MKHSTLSTLLLATALLPNFAQALTSSDAAKIDAHLSQQHAQARGAVITPVSRNYIENAITRVGGNATVDFGRSGGVIVGSGADGLIATSNQANGGPIMVTPPVTPQTSITVVGRAGATQVDEFCITKMTTDDQGKVVVRETDYSKSICRKLGNPIRAAAGKYVVQFSHSVLLVDLKLMENKVIPLREIAIARVNGTIAFGAYREMCSRTELTKSVTMHKASSGNLYKDEPINDVVDRIEKQRKQHPNMKCIFVIENYLESSSSQLPIAQGNDGNFFSVLPGVYQIAWRIDEQEDHTKGIVVE